MDLEQSEMENTNLRILEWMHKLEAEEKEAQNIQQVYISAGKHLKAGNALFAWKKTDRPLDIPPDNLSPTPSTWTSINIFVRAVGVGLTHTKSLLMKKRRKKRETNRLDLDQEEAEPTIGRNFKNKFEIPNEYSKNILITVSHFILSDRSSAICT